MGSHAFLLPAESADPTSSRLRLERSVFDLLVSSINTTIRALGGECTNTSLTEPILATEEDGVITSSVRSFGELVDWYHRTYPAPGAGALRRRLMLRNCGTVPVFTRGAVRIYVREDSFHDTDDPSTIHGPCWPVFGLGAYQVPRLCFSDNLGMMACLQSGMVKVHIRQKDFGIVVFDPYNVLTDTKLYNTSGLRMIVEAP